MTVKTVFLCDVSIRCNLNMKLQFIMVMAYDIGGGTVTSRTYQLSAT